MKLSLKKGFSFGLTSGVITTLGLVVGLHSSTHSQSVIIGAILIIAIADALSDSLGMHISEESHYTLSHQEIWESTFATFIAKFFMATTFIIPFLLFSINRAIYTCILWGLSVLTLLSYHLARRQKISPFQVIGEHLLIAIVVIVATHYIGEWINSALQ